MILSGPCIGSFFALYATRWPEGRDWITDPSCCDSCGARIRGSDLVPVLGWVLLGGRCRACHASIGIFPLVMELACLAAPLLALAIFGATPEAVFATVLLWLVIPVVVIDAQHFLIPDMLTGLLAVTGLASALFLSRPELLEAVIGAILAGGGAYLVAEGYRRFRHRDGLGMGDVKLFAAAGLWLGWRDIPMVFLLSAVCALGFLVLRSILLRAPLMGTTVFPFGVAIAPMLFLLWGVAHA